MQKLLRLPEVRSRCALSRSTIYGQVAIGELPPPIKIGARAVAWISNEIDAVNHAKIQGKKTHEIRSLVTQLVASRGSK